jgi:hypothetical protein
MTDRSLNHYPIASQLDIIFVVLKFWEVKANFLYEEDDLILTLYKFSDIKDFAYDWLDLEDKILFANISLKNGKSVKDLFNVEDL